MVTLEMIQQAQQNLKGVARLTPLISAPKIGENVSIKAENLQLTGSFKLRGAYNKISTLTPEEKAKGVIACSAGNHAQGVALSATKNGIHSTICIPAGAPLSKVEATRGFGGDVVLVPGVYDDAYAEAVELTNKKGYTFVHPFDDEDVIEGQGTIAIEILEELPDADVILVPIGGGGLIAGIACAAKQINPNVKIYGVEPEGAASALAAIHEDQVVTLAEANTIADGTAVKTIGNKTFEYIKKYVDGLYHQRVAAKANRETENIYFSLQDIKHDIIRDLKLQYKKSEFSYEEEVIITNLITEQLQNKGLAKVNYLGDKLYGKKNWVKKYRKIQTLSIIMPLILAIILTLGGEVFLSFSKIVIPNFSFIMILVFLILESIVILMGENLLSKLRK